MGNADETGDALSTKEQMPPSGQESLDYAITRLRDALTRMNQYGEKVQNLHRQLEECGKSIKSLQVQKAVVLEKVFREKGLQQVLDGGSDAPTFHAALRGHMEQLEKRLEIRLRRLEQMQVQRLALCRAVHAGVQADVGEAEQPTPTPSHSCGRRQSWWCRAAVALCAACLLLGALFLSEWPGGLGSVVIHIDPKPQ